MRVKVLLPTQFTKWFKTIMDAGIAIVPSSLIILMKYAITLDVSDTNDLKTMAEQPLPSEN